MGPEGELRIGLRVSEGRIGPVRITSTRPDVARSLLQGRTRAEVSAAVPLLFSICGRSQAAASELACAAAAAEVIAPATLARCSAAVSAETVREDAWRTLLDWPQWIAETPSDAAVVAARASLGFGLDAQADPGTSTSTSTSANAQRIAIAVFGVDADEWLAMASLPELDRWLDAGSTATARFVRQVRDDDASAGARRERTTPCTPLLDAQHHAACMVELSEACDADPEFAAEVDVAREYYCDYLEWESVTLGKTSRNPLPYFARLKAERPARYIDKATMLVASFTGDLPAEDGKALLHAMFGQGVTSTYAAAEPAGALSAHVVEGAPSGPGATAD